MSPSIPSPSPTPTTISTPSPVTILSKSVVYPDPKTQQFDLALSVSDLPMLSCHYIQKGLFFPPPPIPIPLLVPLLSASLSRALSVFPPLAGRLLTLPDGRITVSCSPDTGSVFSHASAPSLTLPLLLPPSSDVPSAIKHHLFPLDSAVSHDGHFLPLSSFQLTVLGDNSLFLACAVNHAIVDGTSFWNFFNAWAEITRSPSIPAVSRPPDLRRTFFPHSTATLRFPNGTPPSVTFPVDAPLRERIFHFPKNAIQTLKSKSNATTSSTTLEITSSFQSLCAQLWKSVTRARIIKNKKLHPLLTTPETTTTFRMAVNCRKRVVPAVEEYYFGNAIQSIATRAGVEEVAEGELWEIAGKLRRSVVEYGDEKIREAVGLWEEEPRCFPLGNPGGFGVTMGSSPRFGMYKGNDFGWGEPAAVRSGRGNKFDGKVSAFPGREGGGSVELEVCLEPETMAGLLEDEEFMGFVSEEETVVAAAV